MSILSTDGQKKTLLVSGGVSAGDQILWSADSQYLYYHSGNQSLTINSQVIKRNIGSWVGAIQQTVQASSNDVPTSGYEELHRIDLQGHDAIVWHHVMDDSCSA